MPSQEIANAARALIHDARYYELLVKGALNRLTEDDCFEARILADRLVREALGRPCGVDDVNEITEEVAAAVVRRLRREGRS